MLKPRPRPAQDSMKNALSCPQWQSREAGSCMGGQRTLDRAAFEGDKSGVYSIKGEIDERSYGAKRHARAVSVPGLRSSRRAHRR